MYTWRLIMAKESLIKTKNELEELAKQEFIHYHLNKYKLKYIEEYESNGILFEDEMGNKFFVMVTVSKQGGYDLSLPSFEEVESTLASLGKERICYLCPFYFDGLKENSDGTYSLKEGYTINYVHAISFKALLEDLKKEPKERLIKNNSKPNKNGFYTYTVPGTDEVIRREFVNLMMPKMKLKLEYLYGLDSLVATRENGTCIFIHIRTAKKGEKTIPVPPKFVIETILSQFKDLECFYLPIFVNGLIDLGNGLKQVPATHQLAIGDVYPLNNLIHYYQSKEE